MAKLLNKKTWYLEDLDNYNEEFLKEIVIDLHEKLKFSKERIIELHKK